MEFLRETKTKSTQVGLIPEDWNLKEIGEIGQVVTGTTPRTKVKEYWNGKYPFVTPTDISKKKYVFKTERTVSEEGAKVGRLIPRDSVLVTCIASIGKSALAFEECITNQQINAIICDDEIDPHYIYYVIKHRENALKDSAGKTTNAIVKKSLFEKFPIPLPLEYDEQRRISAILSSVDSLIQQTDSIIQKTQELKKGLLQELLTRGIGHKEFKYSEELGHEIPKEWDVKNIGELCDVNKEALSNKTNNDYEFLYIDIGGVAYAGAKPTMQHLVFKDAPSRARRKVKKDDILVSTVRPYLRAFTYIEGDIDNLICSTGYSVLSAKQAIHPRFVYQYILSDYFLNQLVPMGSSYPAVTSKQIERVKIPLPKKEEQRQIATIMTNIDIQIDNEIQTKKELEKIKKVLMQILLTGQVRIKVD